MNTYRVDVSDRAATVPAGMNSIRYLGDNWMAAKAAFIAAPIHTDAWNQPNPACGVILSAWQIDGYVVKAAKGFH